ncbi:MAG: hypothetical protein GX567_04265 [Clostridia bacterium]|nr:hypothetical protein [Clostridia bacterium]
MIVSENGENVYIKEVEQQIKKYSKDILKLQAAVEDGKIIYRIFIKEGSGFDPKPVLEDYNSKVTKKDRIIFYDILYTQMAPLQFKHE